MSLEESFEENITNWIAHCKKTRFSSNPHDYIDCEAYRNLVSRGREIFPLLYSLKDRKDIDQLKLGVSFLLAGIEGEAFQIPEEIRGKVGKMWDYSIEWLRNQS